jgi:2-aminoadipate transaminase
MPTARQRRLLHYTGSVPEPLAAQVDSGVVVSLGTFSKMLAPGLRLGWIQSSETRSTRWPHAAN